MYECFQFLHMRDGICMWFLRQVLPPTLGRVDDVYYAMCFLKIVGMGSFTSWILWWVIYRECEGHKSDFIIIVLQGEP